MDDLRVVLGAAVGAGLMQLVTGLYLRDELRSLRAWCRDLAKHLRFPPPPEPRPESHR